jgi:putative transposase
MLVRTGRVPMLGRSRWAGPGGSSRTVPRFFATGLPWAMLLWVCWRQQVSAPGEVSRLVGEEVVGTKAGQTTPGLDRCFASWYGQPVPGLAFFPLSLVRVQARRALPLRGAQVVRSDAEQAASKAQAAAQPPPVSPPTRRPGRPPGHTHTTKTPVTLAPALVRITAMMDALLPRLMQGGPLTALVLDGHVGHPNALPLARPCAFHRMATRRYDAACSLPDTGPDAGRGPHRTDGRKIDDDTLPGPSLTETTVEGDIQTRLSHMPLLHKECAQPWPVVIIATTPLRPQARAPGIRLRSDVDLADTSLVDEARLRLHLAFPFRDAQQSWGLEDCMPVPPTGVTHAAHLSLFMVNVASRLRADLHARDADSSVLDLTADCRGATYVEETRQMLPEKPAPVLFAKILHQVAGLGRIHVSPLSFSFASLAKVLLYNRHYLV